MASTLRELKKQRTREAIADSALELFTTQGYDLVTMAAVAQAAGVGERTVYRYFSDKEEMVFAEDRWMQTALDAAMADASAEADPLSTIRIASRSVAAALERDPVRLRQQATLVAATPALRARDRIKQDGWLQLIAEALASRGVEHPRARLYGAIGVACFVEALARWLESPPAATSLVRELDGTLAEVLDLKSP